jgi:hypothetical protein
MTLTGLIHNRTKRLVFVRVPWGNGGHRILTYPAKGGPAGEVGATVEVERSEIRTRPEGGWTT